MTCENTQTMMSGYIMVDSRSPKGHKIGASGIQGTKLSHQDLDLATYIDNSDTGLEHLMIRSNFSTATWHSTRWVTKLPILSNEQSHGSSCLSALTYRLFSPYGSINTGAWSCNASLSSPTLSLIITLFLVTLHTSPCAPVCATATEQNKQVSKKDRTSTKLSQSLENFSHGLWVSRLPQ